MRYAQLPAALLLAAAATAAPWQVAVGQERAKTPDAQQAGPNLLVTIRVGDPGRSGEDAERTFRLVTRAGGPRARMLVGWRTPIPTERAAPGEGGSSGVTSYVYQNVGMSASLETRLLGDGRILLIGDIELSGRGRGEKPPAGGETGPPPIIGTFQQGLDVVLVDGEPLRVAEVPDPEGGRRFLEITARTMGGS